MRDGAFGGGAGEPVGEQGEPHEQPRAGERGAADPRVEEKADADIERHPGQVEEGGRPSSGEEAADLIEIAQGLLAIALVAGVEGEADYEAEHPPAQGMVKGGTDADQDAATDEIERALEGVEG